MLIAGSRCALCIGEIALCLRTGFAEPPGVLIGLVLPASTSRAAAATGLNSHVMRFRATALANLAAGALASTHIAANAAAAVPTRCNVLKAGLIRGQPRRVPA
jgi:hypothetical protein